MTREEAEKYADVMTYKQAISNLFHAKNVPYRKATFIKINELLDELEQDKPMVEIDLYSVIKQKYIEREVLDKIRAEIEKQEKWLLQAGYNIYNVDIAFNSIKLALAENEVDNGNED